MKQSYKTLLLWIALFLVFVAVFNVFNTTKQKSVEIPFSTFVQELESKKVAEVTFQGEQNLNGKYKPDYKEGRYFKTLGTTGAEAFKLVRDNGIVPNYQEAEKTPLWQTILISWGPVIFIFVLFIKLCVTIRFTLTERVLENQTVITYLTNLFQPVFMN